MTDTWTFVMACAAGGLLGLLFFSGLWWTVQKSCSWRTPGLWIAASFLLRTALVVMGFYYVSGGSLGRLLFCLLGFMLARPLVSRLTRPLRTLALSPEFRSEP